MIGRRNLLKASAVIPFLPYMSLEIEEPLRNLKEIEEELLAQDYLLYDVQNEGIHENGHKFKIYQSDFHWGWLDKDCTDASYVRKTKLEDGTVKNEMVICYGKIATARWVYTLKGENTIDLFTQDCTQSEELYVLQEKRPGVFG